MHSNKIIKVTFIVVYLALLNDATGSDDNGIDPKPTPTARPSKNDL